MEKYIRIASHFVDPETIGVIMPLGKGLINDTFKVMSKNGNEPKYVLQRINDSVFTDVELLQSNIEAVTAHIRKKLEDRHVEDVNRKVLHFLKADSNKTYVKEDGSFWRMMDFIADSYTYDAVTPEYSYTAGLSFGQFEGMLADLKEPIGEIIPNFHNIEFRLQQLEDAVKADAVGRMKDPVVKEYLEKIQAQAERMCLGERLYREGQLPKRICHCDTKVNNMLFDAEGQVLCVIDLDTVMPSFVFSDFGDFLRSAANTGAEDDSDLSKVNFNMAIFDAFAKGYLEGTKDFLLPVEKENLPYAALLFPYMQTVRFFADYINGDTYYKIQYPEHNLVRTKAQWKLFESADACYDAMQHAIMKY